MSQEDKLLHLLLANLELAPFKLLCNFPYKIAFVPEQSLLFKGPFGFSSSILTHTRAFSRIQEAAWQAAASPVSQI